MNRILPTRLLWLVLVGLVVVGLGFRPAWRSLKFSARVSGAREAMLAGKPEQAIELLKAADEDAPDRADLQYLLAVASRRANQFERGDVYLQRAQRAGWPQEDIDRQKLLKQAQQGDFSQAGEWMKSLPEDASDEVADEICEAFAQGNLALLKFREALYWLEAWSNIRPDAVQPRMLQARIYIRVDRHDLARKLYGEALRIDPQHREARLKLGDNLLEAGKLKEAIAEYERILAQHPHDPGAALGLAQGHMRLGEAESTRGLFEAALATELTPQQRTKALADLASLDVIAGQIDQAIERLQEAARLWPQEPSVRYKLGQSLRQAGRADEAAGHLEQAQRLQDLKNKIGLLARDMLARPEDVEVRCELGDTALKLGMASEAVQWLSSALLMDPQCHRAHASLAEHYQATGDKDRAERHRRILQSLGDAPNAKPAQAAAPPAGKAPPPPGVRPVAPAPSKAPNVTAPSVASPGE